MGVADLLLRCLRFASRRRRFPGLSVSHLRSSTAPEPFRRAVRPFVPAGQLLGDHHRWRFCGQQPLAQGGALQRPSPHVEAEADQRIALARSQRNPAEQSVDGADRLSHALLEPGLRLLLCDRQHRHHLRAGVAITNGPGSSATGGIGIGAQAAALPGFEQGPALRGEWHASEAENL
jgi:hypothetical protein